MMLHDVPSGRRHNNKTVESFAPTWNILLHPEHALS
jgi:hypothetical protein